MGTVEIIEGLCGFPGRGAGRDAERRAALWLAGELSTPRRRVEVETFWCRPEWALAQAWNVALALAGSLLSVEHARLGAALLLAAALSVIADVTYGWSPARWLTPERASQNVVARPTEGPTAQVELIVTANIDAGRTGLVHRDRLRRPLRRLAAALGDRPPGWGAWLVLGIVWTLGTALARARGEKGDIVAVLQLLPTVSLVIALALLVDLATAAHGPGAGDNAAGAAVAAGLVRALDAAPPAELAVTLLLTGAGDAQGLGLRRHLRAHRARLRANTVVVLGIGPCPAGQPHWLASDGQLFPLGFFAPLRRLSAEVAGSDPTLGLRELRARGCSPALPARGRRLPAITLGCADADGLVARSHGACDTPQRLDPATADRLLHAALQLVDAIDVYLSERLRPG